MQQQFMEWSKGNPGALMFLLKLMQNPVAGLQVIPAIEKSGIRGTDLYVLHSDLCGKDMDKVIKLVTNCPIDVLQDACSRQDYSGRALVAEYLN